MTLYDRMKEACAERDTTITEVLAAVGLSSANTGSWKAGKSPSINAVILIADHLHMSLDELVLGKVPAPTVDKLTDDQIEWLDIIAEIPADRQELCKDFLKTHMTVPEKYKGKKRV